MRGASVARCACTLLAAALCGVPNATCAAACAGRPAGPAGSAHAARAFPVQAHSVWDCFSLDPQDRDAPFRPPANLAHLTPDGTLPMLGSQPLQPDKPPLGGLQGMGQSVLP